MNPSSNEAPGLNLPPPVSEQAPVNANITPVQPESLPAAEAAPMPMQANGASMPVLPLPVASNQSTTQQVVDVSTTNNVVPVATQESDLIEKAIVDKAKAIIEKNRDDPHKQTEEIAVFKADHIGKKYNKVIKTKSSNT